MIDTINSMNLDITKNLHGHVRVETRDRWTGRVIDSQEKDNLVTNAVQKIIASSSLLRIASQSGDTPSDWFCPLFSKLLGGVFLFNGTLTENASNIYFPSTAKLVAYAGQGTDASLSTMGTYNNAESTFVSNGFTTVWDFSTSQANGTIASLARTSSYFSDDWHAFGALDLLKGGVNTFTDYSRCIGYDETNHYLYIALYTNQTVNGVVYPTTTIYRAKKNLEKVGLINVLPPASQLTVVKTLTSSDGSSTALDFIYDKYADNFVYISGSTIHLIATDGTHTTKSVSAGGTFRAVSENYYWMLTGTTLYRISKSNTADVRSITVRSSGSDLGNVVDWGNDVICVARYGTNASFDLVYPDESVLEFTVNNGNFFGNVYCYNLGIWYGISNSNFPAYSSHYLGTIANLDSPVTKTSSQTMKITYTLTEA